MRLFALALLGVTGNLPASRRAGCLTFLLNMSLDMLLLVVEFDKAIRAIEISLETLNIQLRYRYGKSICKSSMPQSTSFPERAKSKNQNDQPADQFSSYREQRGLSTDYLPRSFESNSTGSCTNLVDILDGPCIKVLKIKFVHRSNDLSCVETCTLLILQVIYMNPCN